MTNLRCSDREVPGPCAECGADEVCATFDGRPLCYAHWHAAREATPPFMVQRVDSPEHVAKYGHWYWGGMFPSVMMQDEAESKCAELNASGDGNRWEVVTTHGWHGDRHAHPGYLNRRRAAILAKHPEYAGKL